MKLTEIRLSPETDAPVPPENVVFGRCEAMQVVRQKIEKVAGANIPVLIQGESGTGKEVIARLVHARSPWRSGAFVKVSCPAVPGTLIENELFGYEKRSFTGANGTKAGRVELAQNGTLFLDEIAELNPSSQAKLLQVLQEGQFCGIGGQEDKRIDVRIICATTRNLEQEVEKGSFRRDLFYRINVFNIQIPSLRERLADIPEICDFFREMYSEKFDRPSPPISAAKLDLLQRYEWPGNIRELENLIKRYVILGSEEAISVRLARNSESSVSIADTLAHESISLKKVTRQAVVELERKIILKILQAHNWNRRRAATALNISYRALLYKLKQSGMAPKNHGDAPSSGLEGN